MLSSAPTRSSVGAPPGIFAGVADEELLSESERWLTVERDVTQVSHARPGELSLDAIHSCQHRAVVLPDDGVQRHAGKLGAFAKGEGGVVGVALLGLGYYGAPGSARERIAA